MTHTRPFNRHTFRAFIALTTSLVMAGCSSEDDLTGSGGATQLSTAQVSWVAPVEREDSTPLSPAEIAGYRIYYGLATGDYQNEIEIKDPSSTEMNISLPTGTYYAVMTTIDAAGRESLFSNELVLVI